MSKRPEVNKGSTGKTRVVVMGLDGATFDLIEPWVKEGKLPTFSRLIKNAVSGPLTSVFPPLSASAWSSLMTGKNQRTIESLGIPWLMTMLKNRVFSERLKLRAIYRLSKYARNMLRSVADIPILFLALLSLPLQSDSLLTPHSSYRV